MFERERTLTFDPKVIAEYAKETGRIKLNQASRKREKESKRRQVKGINTLYDFRKKLQHENLINSLQNTVQSGKQVKKEDADKFVEHIKEKNSNPAIQKSLQQTWKH